MASTEREPIIGSGGRAPEPIEVQGQSPGDEASYLSIFKQNMDQKLSILIIARPHVATPVITCKSIPRRRGGHRKSTVQ